MSRAVGGRRVGASAASRASPDLPGIDRLGMMLAMNELEDFRAAARAQDVPDDVIDWWLQLARPRLEPDREGDGPVAGYFGGKPALPAGVAWPDGMADVDALLQPFAVQPFR